MIRLTRIRTAQAIPAKYRGGQRVLQGRTLIRQRLAAEGFTSGFWTSAKVQLRREASGKCAYCEAPAATVAHADVEHYRPKSSYWWLAYCYDNYLYSCEICNQSYKRAAFPATGPLLALEPPFPDPFPEGMADDELDALADRLAPDPVDGPVARDRFYAASEAELPEIPNPYDVEPERLFAWEADGVLREGRLVAGDQSERAVRATAAAEAFLGLNREELLRVRWEHYENAELCALVIGGRGVPEDLRARSRSVLARMAEDAAPFAGMVRYFLRRWGLTDLLPEESGL